MSRQPMITVGITTVKERIHTLFRETLQHILNTGFERVYVFVDDARQDTFPTDCSNVKYIYRQDRIKTMANWYLGMTEMYMRHPESRYYVMFQDDIICCKNLKNYIVENHNKNLFPENGYFNLITYPANQAEIEKVNNGNEMGWFLSNQRGLGAQGLLFSNKAFLALSSTNYILERVHNKKRGWKSIDGGIVSAMKKAGYKEYIHHPSLIRHVGKLSTMGNKPQPQDKSFVGTEFDITSILE